MIRTISLRFSAALGALIFTTILGATSASYAGTSAKMISAGTLLTGPGATYTQTGSVEQGNSVNVERCLSYYCEIDANGARGWIDRSKLSFGQHARGALSGPKFDRKSGGPGEVCFHEGEQFSGRTICGGSGYVIRDLAKTSFNDRFSSVTVSGNVSAMVCRDFFFASYCEHITVNTPKLDKLLNREVSSIRVY